MTMTNRYDSGNRNHTMTCTRRACSGPEVPSHEAGRHLDQRSEHYDGPDTLLGATSVYVRASARKIISQAPELTPEVVDLMTYLEFMRDQVAAAHVDRDRGIREASKRALDCDAHGEVITGLESQVAAFSAAERKAENGRLALLGFLTAVDEFTQRFREGYSGFTSPAQVVSALETASKKAHAAHTRAWSK